MDDYEVDSMESWMDEWWVASTEFSTVEMKVVRLGMKQVAQ
jgi:hypothetical protein